MVWKQTVRGKTHGLLLLGCKLGLDPPLQVIWAGGLVLTYASRNITDDAWQRIREMYPCYRTWSPWSKTNGYECKNNNDSRSNHYLLVIFQELDYGALYEVRTPHFYVEANKMPTARVSEIVCILL